MPYGWLFRVLVPAALCAAPLVALAEPYPLVVGDTIYDPAGAEVGRVQAIKGDAAVIWTGTVKVTLGLGSFARRGGRPTIAMSRPELEKAAGVVQAKGDSDLAGMLQPGTILYDSEGAAAATVEAVNGKEVTVLVDKAKATLPVSSLSKGRHGVEIATTAADFRAKIAAQVPPAAAPSPQASEAPRP